MQHCHNCCDWLKRPLVTFWKSNKETLGSPPAAVIIAETWQIIVYNQNPHDGRRKKQAKNIKQNFCWKLTCWSEPCCPKDTRVLTRSPLLIMPSLGKKLNLELGLGFALPVFVNGGKDFVTFIFFPFFPHYPTKHARLKLARASDCHFVNLAIARRNSPMSTVSDLMR